MPRKASLTHTSSSPMQTHHFHFSFKVMDNIFLCIYGFLLLTASIITKGVESNIGVNYGTMGNNLPPPSQVAEFLLESTTINRVRLFNSDPDILRAFAHTGIAVTVTVSNDQIPNLTNLSSAANWVHSYVTRFSPATNIVRILVGNEVLSTADNSLVSTLVPAMHSLHAALAAAGLRSRIQVSTPHSLGVLAASTPPSAGRFRRGYDTHVLKPLLRFLRATGSPFLVNPYPFFGCSPATLDYALFRPNPGVFDDNTRVVYTNMLDAQLDAVYSAMRRLGFGDVEIVVAETGWPSAGDEGQFGVDKGSAADYNGNLVKHVMSGRGTPLMPNRTFETYIFGLFNENLKPGPASERNFGLFRPDMTPVYDIGIMRPTARSSNPANRSPAAEQAGKRRWCLPKTGAEAEALQRNIDYVCGQRMDVCGPIKQGGECFLPNTVRAHAAFAMNAFYEATGKNDFDCDFDQTGAISDVDPSYGKCKY